MLPKVKFLCSRHFSISSSVSEILVDQLLSTVLSTSLLGFLLLHTKLIEISPLLVVGIYGILFSIILYNLFIFAPSVKKARQARIKKAQSMKEFGRSKVRWQKRQTVGSDILRRCKKFKEYCLDRNKICSYHTIKCFRVFLFLSANHLLHLIRKHAKFL